MECDKKGEKKSEAGCSRQEKVERVRQMLKQAKEKNTLDGYFPRSVSRKRMITPEKSTPKSSKQKLMGGEACVSSG